MGYPTTNGYTTAKEIINRAAIQCGIATGSYSTMADPFTSSDPNFAQLIDHLNTLGQNLNNVYDWTHFVKEFTITTAGSATAYDLPADFTSMVDQSGWNRSMMLPIVGPMSGQEAQFIKARLGNVLINVAFRIQGNQMTFPLAPANGQTIVFEYGSNYWVQSAASVTGPDNSEITAATDFVLYDPGVMIAGLKMLWRENHGLDTTQDERRYNEVLESYIGRNRGARMIDLAGGGLNQDHIIDGNNIPVGSWS